MAEKKKGAAAAAAAAQEAPEVKTQEVKLNTNHNPNTKGLTQGEKVAYVTALQTERAFMLTNTENPSQGTIEGLTLLAQATIIDIAIGEIASGTSATGHIILANENNYKALQAMAFERGVKLPEYKALPAPTEEQMKAAGIIGLLPAEARVMTVSKENVSEEAIKQKKEEQKIITKAVENPAEVENDEQLKASLTAMLVKPIVDGKDGVDARVNRTVRFYRGYLTIQANKIEDKEKKDAELKALKEKSLVDLLNEIAEIVGSCPFVIHGAAHHLRNFVSQTGNPLASFCLYRRTALAKDGSVEDQHYADVVRTLIIWSCNGRIADIQRNIKEAERLIKKNQDIIDKDAKSTEAKVAKSAIKKWNEDIDQKFKPEIAALEELIAETTNPSLEVVDNLVEDYNCENEENENRKLARRMVDDVMKTYYKGVDREKLDQDIMLKNVQQRAGVILNMFRDPLSRSISYSESNITDMVEKPAEEKTEE